MKPIVSIIVPVYNVEKYIQQCLYSLLNQDFKDIEIIAINDGSTDNSLAILNEINDARLVILTQENQGQSSARNFGLKHARGEYILFVDADDYLELNTVGKLVEELSESKLELIRFGARAFNDDVNFDIVKGQYDFSSAFVERKVYKKDEFLIQLKKAYSASPCLYIVKRSILIDHAIVFENAILHEDELFSLRVFLNVNYAGYINETFYNRRYRSGSVMTTAKNINQDQSFESYVYILNKLADMYNNTNRKSESELIKTRMKLLYGITSNCNVSQVEKRNKLLSFSGLSTKEKVTSNYRYKIKKVIKYLYFLPKKILKQ